VANAALHRSINDQLGFLQNIRIRHFGLVAGFDQCFFKAAADHVRRCHHTKQPVRRTVVSACSRKLGFSMSLDGPPPMAGNNRTGRFPRFCRWRRCLPQQGKANAAAFGVFAAHCVAGASGPHDYVNTGFGSIRPKVNVKPWRMRSQRPSRCCRDHVFL